MQRLGDFSQKYPMTKMSGRNPALPTVAEHQTQFTLKQFVRIVVTTL